jgi:hypothetical protein
MPGECGGDELEALQLAREVMNEISEEALRDIIADWLTKERKRAA